MEFRCYLGEEQKMSKSMLTWEGKPVQTRFPDVRSNDAPVFSFNSQRVRKSVMEVL